LALLFPKAITHSGRFSDFPLFLRLPINQVESGFFARKTGGGYSCGYSSGITPDSLLLHTTWTPKMWQR